MVDDELVLSSRASLMLYVFQESEEKKGITGDASPAT